MPINTDDLEISRSSDRNTAALHARIISQHVVTRSGMSASSIASQHGTTRDVTRSQHGITRAQSSSLYDAAVTERSALQASVEGKVESQHVVTRTHVSSHAVLTVGVTRSQHGETQGYVSQQISAQNDFMLQNIGKTPGPQIAFVNDVDLPETGSKNLKVIVRNYDIAGFDVDADSFPQISIWDFAGAPSFGVANDTNMTNTGVGSYEFNFTVDFSDTPGEYRIQVKVVNNAKLTTLARAFNLIDFDNTPVTAKVQSAHVSTRSQLDSSIGLSESALTAVMSSQDVLVSSQHTVTKTKVESQHVETRGHVTSQNGLISQLMVQLAKQQPRLEQVQMRPVFSPATPGSALDSNSDGWVGAAPSLADAGGATPQLRWSPMYAFVINHPYSGETFNTNKFEVEGGLHLHLKWKSWTATGIGGNSFWVVRKGDDSSSGSFDAVISQAEANPTGPHALSPQYPANVSESVHVLNTVLKTTEMEELPFTVWLAGQVNTGGTQIDAKVSSRIMFDFTLKSSL